MTLVSMKRKCGASATAHNPKPSGPTPQAPEREPTAQEIAAVKEFTERSENPSVRLKVLAGEDSPQVAIHYHDEVIGRALYLKALGTTNLDFSTGLVYQLVNLNCEDGEIKEPELNFAFSVVKGINPRDQLEAMLAAQMAAVHKATLAIAHRFTVSGSIIQQDSSLGALNKLARTFTMQMETLKRYRTDGPRTVQNVCVTDGGQALVANVTQAPRDSVPEKRVPSASVAEKTNVVPLATRDETKENTAASVQGRKQK